MRELLVLGYGFLTMIICGQAMLNSSFRVGSVALVACVLNFTGMAIFFVVFLARLDKEASKKKLIGAGAIALILVAAAFALMIRSQLWIAVFDNEIPGPVWLVAGFAAALLWAMDRRVRARSAW